ncbi:hypothetical protein AUJ65_05240 [Candidatus Micrarchaeota archaeon CG1_02_51_15]|nr:MAG: hypothetical protein AUJ65_05240 [Candidatus Micrarchaeota archaeon CG1_02_51_15]
MRAINKGNSSEIRETRSELVPKDGHYGTNRNQLSLLAAYHGGTNAAYLHLDDDTTLKRITRKDSGRVKLIDHKRDLLKDMLSALRTAEIHGYPGISLGIIGVPDAGVSADTANAERLVDALKNPKVTDLGHPFAYGRITNIRALEHPYEPYGLNSDQAHSMLLTTMRGKLIPRDLEHYRDYASNELRELRLYPYYQPEEFRVMRTPLVHLGLKGRRPTAKTTELSLHPRDPRLTH